MNDDVGTAWVGNFCFCVGMVFGAFGYTIGGWTIVLTTAGLLLIFAVAKLFWARWRDVAARRDGRTP